jgi:hypothetical protein
MGYLLLLRRAPYSGDHIMWGALMLQTVFACVVAAILLISRAAEENDAAATYYPSGRAEY